MVVWLNRAVFAAPRNGTTSHTITPSSATNLISGAAFTPTAGRLLVVVIEGAVTSTTPSGWTLPANGSAINSTGLYVWYRTAAGSDTFTTTHNGSNYPVVVAVYEFPAGSTFVKSAAGTGIGYVVANPNLTALTGTNLVMGAKALGALASGSTMSAAWSGTGSPVEDLETVAVAGSTDGYGLTIGYVEGFTGTSWQPTASLTCSSMTPNAEALTFAIAVAGGVTNYDEVATVSGAGSVAPSVVVGKEPASSITGSGTVVAAATLGLVAGASLAGVGSLTGAAVVGKSGTAAISGTGSLTASVVVTAGTTVSATLGGTGSVVATGQVGKTTTAPVTGTGSVSASSVVGKTDAVVLAGTGSVAATVTVTTAGQASAAIAGTGLVSASIVLGRPKTVSLAGTGTVAANIQIGKTVTAALAGMGAVTVGTIPLRDITLTGETLAERWAATEAGQRYATEQTADRLKASATPARWDTTQLTDRWRATT